MIAKPLTPEAHARLLRLVTVLAFVLIAAGVVVLTSLPRLPVPLRMMAGLGDIVIGLVLLVMVRQQREKTPDAKLQTPTKSQGPSSKF